MGLTAGSTGRKAADCGFTVRRTPGTAAVVALAGNPNVGKSTVFNALTGMRQHTGNWPGKTVAGAAGVYRWKGAEYAVVDTPGAYSLLALSAEEEAARDFICFGGADLVAVVCDATCLERNMNLILQTLEITPRVVVALNLMDEAAKHGIRIDVPALEKRLGVPVVPMSARRGRGLSELREAIRRFPEKPQPFCARYPDALEDAVSGLAAALEPLLAGRLNARWTALRLLEGDEKLLAAADAFLGFPLREAPPAAAALRAGRDVLAAAGYTPRSLRDAIVSSLYAASETICAGAVTCRSGGYGARQLALDVLLTRRSTGIPVMLALLALIFYITLRGANYPSSVLFRWLNALGGAMDGALVRAGAPQALRGALILGVWRVLSWVVSVMLPPMAIFFPLFTLLEDLGYLPRVAFDLDESFRRAGACGRQALTMCMGFGCNAAGVTGCRIIASPRERLIAVLTNSFVPCNGRFPLLIAVIGMFFAGSGALSGILSALLLTAFVLLGTAATLAVSGFLSKTLLRGVPSSLTLELPPFRRPQIGRVLVRSVLDRTLFVLGRAATAAAPAGLVLWLAANLRAGGGTLLSAVTAFLDPAGRFLGMDGVILTAFVLGIPANEIVLPIVIMAYASESAITGFSDVAALRTLLVQHGWTRLTALCVMLFSLFHWPCATTLLTVKKETGSAWLTLLSLALPTALGAALCAAAAAAARLLGLA